MSALKTVLRLIAGGPLLGALVYLGLFVVCVTVHRSAEYMGVEDSSVTDRVMALFEDAITAQQLGILALYLGLGAGLGALAGGGLEVLRRVRQRPFRWRRHLAATLGLVVLLHALVMLRSMAVHPAVYAPGAQQSFVVSWLLALAVDGPPPATWDVLLAGLGLALLAGLGVLAARRALSPLVPAALGLAAGVALALAGRPRDLTRAHADPPPNVLVLAVDSLRADVLEHPEVLPNITRWAARATTYTRMIPTVPRTYPSWASMLTGQYPHHHGVRHMFPLPVAGKVIAHGLPEDLAAFGYRTAVISDFAGDVFERGDFGFEHVDAPGFTLASNVALGGVKLHVHLLPWLVDLLPDGGGYRKELLALERLSDPRWVEDAALDWLAADRSRPFFLVAFFSAGHFPFASPAPYWHRFTDPDYRGRSRFLKESFGSSLDAPEHAAEVAHLRGLYHGALAASDAAIGRVLDALDAAGVLANTVVIITSDHGENLYEHGLGMGHGDHLYGRTTLEVPLLLDFPGNTHRGQWVDVPLSLCDVATTIRMRLGVPSRAPPETLAGIDLAAPVARPVFSEIDLWFFPPETRRLDHKRIVGVEGFAGFTFDPKDYEIFLDRRYQPLSVLAKHRAVIEAKRKLVYVPTRDGVRFELYDPLTDPGDEHDLAAREPAEVERMKAILYRWMLEDPQLQRVGDFVVPRDGAP